MVIHPPCNSITSILTWADENFSWYTGFYVRSKMHCLVLSTFFDYSCSFSGFLTVTSYWAVLDIRVDVFPPVEHLIWDTFNLIDQRIQHQVFWENTAHCSKGLIDFDCSSDCCMTLSQVLGIAFWKLKPLRTRVGRTDLPSPTDLSIPCSSVSFAV